MTVMPFPAAEPVLLSPEFSEDALALEFSARHKGCAEIIPFRVRDWVESARCCAGGRSMQRQGSFAEAEYAGKKKQTRRDKFLAEMERIVPWTRLVECLATLYPKGKRGRP